MKNILLLALVLSGGCAVTVGPHGLSATPVTPPANAIVRLTVRSIGVHAGQNQATQTPEVTVGYQSATYDRIPTSIGTNIFVPPVRASINVNGGLEVGIKETIESGSATAK